MRVLLRVAAVGVLFLLLGVGAVALLLPRLVESDAFTERLRSAARDATGSELSWGELTVGLLPPRVEVVDATLAHPEAAHEPLEAKRVALRLALLPLLARTVLVDSLELDGVRLHLVRGADGIGMPLLESAQRQPSTPETVEESGEDGFALALQGVALRDSQITLEDRSVSPKTTWEFSDVLFEARGRSVSEPLDIGLAARLASGGTVKAEGRASLDGLVDVEFVLDAVALGPLAAYLGPGIRVGGAANGTIRMQGVPERLDALTVRVTLDEADIALEEIQVRGAVEIEADLAGAPDALAGTFGLDASRAELRYGGSFTKPAGTEATATGRLTTDANGKLAVDGMRLKIKNLGAEGSFRSAPRARATVDAPPFALDGWGAIVPALQPLDPSGRIALRGLEVSTEPLSLAGRIELDDVRVRGPDQPPVVFRGALLGAGTALRSEALTATIAQQQVALEIEVRNLDARPSYRFSLGADEIDANALLTALGSKPDTLSGPLTTRADVSGPLGGERDALETVSGRASLHIGKGRLRGVSLLRAAFDRLGAFGEAALLAGSARGGRTLQRFYEDEFDSIDGTFQIANGMARTNDLVLVYRHYRVELRGDLGLAKQTLDFSGKLVIGPEIDDVVAANAGNADAAAQERIIPLAHVGGTLDSPQVALTSEAAASLAAAYALGGRRTRVEEKIDERLGEGAGKEVLDALEGLLGGRKKP